MQVNAGDGLPAQVGCRCAKPVNTCYTFLLHVKKTYVIKIGIFHLSYCIECLYIVPSLLALNPRCLQIYSSLTSVPPVS
jgi:hypothetical protein